MSSFLTELSEQRRKFLEGLDANQGDINLDIFEDFYPDQAHFVFELLQNAEDAKATEVTFTLTSEGCRFEHNGSKLFDEGDVRAITGIHNSSKKKSADQIGKFGVGFKSVFVYTVSPEITSGEYSFRISRLVMPEECSGEVVKSGWTRFWLPFNNPKKPADLAHQEVAAGLRELAETTLLFLSNIHTISWAIEGADHGYVLRVEHDDEHVEVLKQTNGKKTSSAHFLRFTEAVEGLPNQRVAIAFALEFLQGKESLQTGLPLAQQLKVAAVPGQVAVFFPAEKETSGLRFHLHAPFVPELSRASIKETPVNTPLFAQLAALSAAAMHRVRDLGFLTPEFLGVLPNKQDDLGNRYVPVRQAIQAAFKSEPLMPAYDKSHAPADDLVQAKAALKELLNEADIEFLIEYEETPPKWAANRALQGTRVERFMSDLAITEWDVSEFLQHISGAASDNNWSNPEEDFLEWLQGKPVEWFQQCYAILAHDPDTQDELQQLSDCRIVRLDDGSLSLGEDCYFPDEERKYSGIVPCVDPTLYEGGKSKTQQKLARKFLEEVGVTQIGELELVEALLKKEYSSGERVLKEREHLSHLRRFMKLVEDNRSAARLLAEYKIFMGADQKWHSAKEILLDNPFCDTGLAEYYGIVGYPRLISPLAEFYESMPIDSRKLGKFLSDLGAKTDIDIAYSSCSKNPSWDYLSGVWGERYTSPVDRDYKFDRFNEIVSGISLRLAHLIWRTMIARGDSVLQAQYRKNVSGGSRWAASQLVHQLRKGAWVPQGDTFVRPTVARAELLPEGFVFEPGAGWIKAIEFGKSIALQDEKTKAEAAAAAERKNRKQAAAEELGFVGADALEWLQRLSEASPDERKTLLDTLEHLKAKPEFPEHDSRNPERRAERVGEKARDAAERATVEKTRSVSVGREEVKAETSMYLTSQYSRDGALYCQLCKAPMPFNLDDGTPYFERVEFLPALKRRYFQNYLCLCPNHAAMFMYANGSKDLMLPMFLELEGNELEVILAQANTTIQFTNTHIADLRKVIEVDAETSEPSP